jgi:hypothetical protein
LSALSLARPLSAAPYSDHFLAPEQASPETLALPWRDSF